MRGFLATILRQLERDGQRCGGPVVLAGFAVGFGLVTLSSSLGQASRFGLELLVLVKLQLMGPVLVSLLAMALLLPRWIDRVVQHGGRAWHHSLPAAMGTGLLLMLMLFVAALVGGVLASPRADLVQEVKELLSGIQLTDLLRPLIRSGAFLAMLCGWSQWRAMNALEQKLPLPLVVSNLLVEGLMVALLLKLIWVFSLDPPLTPVPWVMSCSDQSTSRDRVMFLGSGVALFLAVVLGLAREQGWGTRFTTYHLLLDDVSGLSSGQEIRLSGLPIGQVGSLTLQNDASVRVDLKIDQSKATLVGERSRASLGQVGLIGDSYVSIFPDPEGDGLPAGSRLPFQPQPSVQDLIQQVQHTLENTTQLTASQGEINQGIIDLRATLRSTDELSQSLKREMQATSPVVRDSLTSLSEETTRTEREAQKLLRDTRPLIVDTLNEVRDLISPWLEPAS